MQNVGFLMTGLKSQQMSRTVLERSVKKALKIYHSLKKLYNNIVTYYLQIPSLHMQCIIFYFQIKDKSGMLGPLYGDFEKSKVASMCKELGQGTVLCIPRHTIPCICFSFDTNALKKHSQKFLASKI